MNRLNSSPVCRHPIRAWRKTAILTPFFLQFLLVPSLTTAHTVTQEQQGQSLGSLTRVGEVYINDLPAAMESTIFVGDKVRTEENAVASFTASGKGTLKIAPHSVVVFAGATQYLAELKSGTVVMSSFSGPSGFTLRVGDYVVVPAVQEQQTTAKVESFLDGSFPISCLEGSISVISLQGGSGLFLQPGQSGTISHTGQLISNPPSPGPPETSQPTHQPAPPVVRQGSRKGWIILGLAGAGAAAIAAAASAAGGGGHQPVSPSSP